MPLSPRAALVIILLSSAGLASTARAQGVAKSLDELRLLVKAGDTVTVTDQSGSVATGRITSLSSSAIGVQANGQPRTWAESEVAQIWQRRSDPLGNGALWGLGIGVAIPAVALVAWAEDLEAGDAGWIALSVGLYGAMGAGIGVGIDALIKKPVIIFTRTPGGASARLVPIVTGGRRGVALRLSF